MLRRRLAPRPGRWRTLYKALLCAEFLALRGGPGCPQAAAELVPLVDALQGFECVEAGSGKDVGVNVRVRWAAGGGGHAGSVGKA